MLLVVGVVLNVSLLNTAGLNITGEGRGVVVIGNKGVVNLGPNVVFRGHVAIQPGATVMTHQGPVPSPVAVPPGGASGQAGGSQSQEGIVFAKSASTPCKRAGVNIPVHVIEDIKEPKRIAVGRNGEIVVATSKGKFMVFNEKYEKMIEKEMKELSHCTMVINQDNDIVVLTGWGFLKLDMELNELAKVTAKESPSLKQLTTSYGMALGVEGRLYIAGVKQAHIINADLTYYKTFAEKCQAFAIAVSSEGHVYLPVLKVNTIRVFSAEGEPLFQFGEPGRSPVPQFSLLGPMALAVDSHDNVYVGVAMKTVNVFDKEGTFLRVFGSQGSEPGQFEDVPTVMCIDQRGFLYVGECKPRRVQIFKLED